MRPKTIGAQTVEIFSGSIAAIDPRPAVWTMQKNIRMYGIRFGKTDIKMALIMAPPAMQKPIGRSQRPA